MSDPTPEPVTPSPESAKEKREAWPTCETVKLRGKNGNIVEVKTMHAAEYKRHGYEPVEKPASEGGE